MPHTRPARASLATSRAGPNPSRTFSRGTRTAVLGPSGLMPQGRAHFALCSLDELQLFRFPAVIPAAFMRFAESTATRLEFEALSHNPPLIESVPRPRPKTVPSACRRANRRSRSDDYL